jgi:hypothetical protein
MTSRSSLFELFPGPTSSTESNCARALHSPDHARPTSKWASPPCIAIYHSTIELPDLKPKPKAGPASASGPPSSSSIPQRNYPASTSAQMQNHPPIHRNTSPTAHPGPQGNTRPPQFAVLGGNNAQGPPRTNGQSHGQLHVPQQSSTGADGRRRSDASADRETSSRGGFGRLFGRS